MLLAIGVGLFAAAFIVYNQFLGWIDGLPNLPEKYLQVARPDLPPFEPQLENRIDRCLRQAFGDKCAEVDYRYRGGMQIQGVYLATDDYSFEPDGRVKLSPLSLAVIGKINPRTGYREIHTIHCDSAHITFDRRIESWADMGRGRLMAAEFDADPTLSTDPRHGKIVVTSNHGTPTTQDDLIATMPGPLYFRDNAALDPSKPQLWTNKSIEVTDYQASPPHVIKALRLNVFLEPDAMKTDRPTSRPKGQHAGPVNRIELRNVLMILTVDGKSDFLRSTTETASAQRQVGDRSILSIRTLGAFNFDLRTNRANFEIDRRLSSSLRQYVDVVRAQKNGTDELRCERLDLQFRQKLPGSDASSSMEIEEARASGASVQLESPAEKLRASGVELTFNNTKRQVVLRGAPMVAIKDDNRIEGPELILNRLDPKSPPPARGQALELGRATGPGIVFLNDAKSNRSATVRWNENLSIEREGNRDRITLTGGATFDDPQNQQWLQGDQIKLWLAKSAMEALARPAAAGSPPTSRARPEKIHVTGHVRARTPELSIRDTDLIVVWFQDVESLPAGAREPGIGGALPRVGAGPPAAAAKPAPAAPPKKPLELSAETIETFVLRNGEQMGLDRVSCRRRVHVHQQPEKSGDRALDVTGQTLDLTHTSEGDVLKITGITGDLAKIEVNEMTLRGPQIVCDQRDNHVAVDGAGNVRLLASTNLNGEKLDRPSEIAIFWNDRMELAGNRIEFDGGVQAEQESAKIHGRERIKELNRMLCPQMDVFLDRAVSLSQAHRRQAAQSAGVTQTGENPKIKRVICHRGNGQNALQPVTITSTSWTDGKMSQFHRIEAPEVTYDNDAGEVTTAGPGEVRLFQLGDATIEPLAKAGKTNSDSPPEQVFKLTCVKFQGRMRGQNKTRIVTFIGPVRVAHAPTNDPNLTINPDKLPKGAFTLSCQKLDVGAEEKNGRRSMTMVAEGKADIFAPDFSGRADLIKYDEAKKQQIIFDSKDDSNLAVLYHIKVKGAPPRALRGKTIIYCRETNEFKGNGIFEVSGSE